MPASDEMESSFSFQGEQRSGRIRTLILTFSLREKELEAAAFWKTPLLAEISLSWVRADWRDSAASPYLVHARGDAVPAIGLNRSGAAAERAEEDDCRNEGE
jgi:hypothetical protein